MKIESEIYVNNVATGKNIHSHTPTDEKKNEQEGNHPKERNNTKSDTTNDIVVNLSQNEITFCHSSTNIETLAHILTRTHSDIENGTHTKSTQNIFIQLE